MPPTDALTIFNTPKLTDATMLLALTGWMDGGLVSTGTVKHLMSGRDLTRVAYIEPAGYYIENFPGSMEIASAFRPHVKYEDGVVVEFDVPNNEFLADPRANLAFFVGREPNVGWQPFAEHIFDVAKMIGVSRIIFMGSFGGTVPHTREPRMFGSVSELKLRPLLRSHGLKPTSYEGPASFATYLLTVAPRHGIEMLSIAAEIPGYLNGLNPLSIEAVTRRLAAMMNIPVNLADLREASTQWELKVSEAVEKDEDLAGTVRKLEEQYDNELIEATEEE
jgi:proteasome assembly chaperone (PAC2) family protein